MCLVKDIYPGTDPETWRIGSFPSQGVEVNGVLLFAATEPTAGRELWRSDGTDGGAVSVADINPGPASSSPVFIARATRNHSPVESGSDTLFFAASAPSTGRELWKTDGTREGTVQVADIVPGPASSLGPRWLPGLSALVDGILYFTAEEPATGTELWKTDGTEVGTVLVADTSPGSEGSHLVHLTNVQGTLFFGRCDHQVSPRSCELWTSDGTSSGTNLVADIALPFWDLEDANGRLFLAACEDGGDCELWISDGTPDGTVKVMVFNPNGDRDYDDWNPPILASLGDDVLFAAVDDTGQGLWKSDGTLEGTARIVNISGIAPNGSNAFDFTRFNNRVLFRADDPRTQDDDHALWASDGTLAGTTQVGPEAGRLEPWAFTRGGSRVFFLSFSGAFRIWETDGTEEGTVRVTDIPSNLRRPFSRMSQTGGQPFFAAHDQRGTELWTVRSEGEACEGPIFRPTTTSTTPSSSTTVSSTSTSTAVSASPSTSSTSVSTSMTSTTSRTSTTLAPPGCERGDCEEPDPCRQDRCGDGPCSRELLTALCICRRAGGAACEDEPVPPGVTVRLAEGCRLLGRATREPSRRRQRIFAMKAARTWSDLERHLNQRRTLQRLSPDCRAALAGAARDMTQDLQRLSQRP